MDNDGNFKLSQIVSVLQKTVKQLKVYPSIVTNGFLTVETTELGDFQIFNTLGQQVLRAKVAHQIDISFLPKGNYILKIDDQQVKFMKQ